MKEVADTERFREFADAHRKTVYIKMLARLRRQCGDPNWAPTCLGPTHVRTAFHHLSGDRHLHARSEAHYGINIRKGKKRPSDFTQDRGP
jgi:hypothetical protein